MLLTDSMMCAEQPCFQIREGDVNHRKVGVGLFTATIKPHGFVRVPQLCRPIVAVPSIGAHHFSDNHAACVWAEGVRRLVQEDYAGAKRITLVMDNLNTHTGASLYKAFPPDMAKALLDKLELVYTPKHGSWLNVAECEFSVLGRQCLARRLPDIQTVTTEIAAWVDDRNQKTQPADWRFTTEDARIKLKRLYPKLSN